MRIAGMDPTLVPQRTPQIPVHFPQVPAVPAAAASESGNDAPHKHAENNAPLYERFADALAAKFGVEVKVVDPHDATFNATLDTAALVSEGQNASHHHRPLLSISPAPPSVEFTPRELPLQSPFHTGDTAAAKPALDIQA